MRRVLVQTGALNDWASAEHQAQPDARNDAEPVLSGIFTVGKVQTYPGST
jgi:hypothetical protein